MELSEQWQAAGHIVEKYCVTDAFPSEQPSGPRSVFQQLRFPRKALAYVRKHADCFDVIDTLLGTLPFTKRQLGFKGLLVTRSVGFFLLYDRFETYAQKRWPQVQSGTVFGQLFYRYARRQFLRNSSRALASADLLNLPNGDELSFLREHKDFSKSAIIQPYGLTETLRKAFSDSATPPQERLPSRRITFIGMWSARKGSKDWSALIQKMRARCPDVVFRFLGTMTANELVLRDLPDGASKYVEIVAQYQPEDLPGLLKDCAVGAFPSYVEGFGFAVLEQLAAGIPVVAYDAPGPREMLKASFPELLVPCGDIDAMANTLCRILDSQLADYETLSVRSVAVAGGFSWPSIAHETIDQYRIHLADGHRETLLFVQPFGIGGAGGGPRILRALVENTKRPWHSVCVSPSSPQSWPNESHLPIRPKWGKIERSRLAWLPRLTQPLYASRFKRTLAKLCRHRSVAAIHTVPHAGLEFAYTHSVARGLNIPLFLSVHDDLAYSAVGSWTERACHLAMGETWRDAAARFVITRELGEEYCRRFGSQPYHIVTDGLEKISVRESHADAKALRIYFMGLFHLGYEPNLQALDQGLTLLKNNLPGVTVNIVCRCGMIRDKILRNLQTEIQVLPFASEAQIEKDLIEADLVYLPLPFGEEYRRFVQFSLSTKMVTYLGCGLPILYHGPTASAAYAFLREPPSAITLSSLDPVDIEAHLRDFLSTPETAKQLVLNAANLAREKFMLSQQRQTFWQAIEGAMAG